jgi:aminoglycoside phosphotransferase (APT) family kinase protein
MSDLNETALARWMRATVPEHGALLGLAKLSGGQSNPTYCLDTTQGRFVLRRKPFGTLLPSAHAIEREYRLLNAIHPTGFPVPRPIALCEEGEVIGSNFYLMEMVDGRSLLDGTLPSLSKADRRAYYEAMVDTLGALHSINHVAVGLENFGARGDYVARQVERWTRQYRATQTDDIPEVEQLIDWLPRTLPQQSRTSIIHGDYRIDNLIFSSEGPGIRAVIDWELATIGDPLADFAYFAMNWVMPRDGRSGLDGVDLEAEGLPNLNEMIERYCVATGRPDLPDLHWYFAYNLFRLTGIVQGC